MALENIEIDIEISQEVLLEFSKIIKEHIYDLWQETDQYLESCGLELPAHELAQPHIPEQLQSFTETTELAPTTEANAVTGQSAGHLNSNNTITTSGNNISGGGYSSGLRNQLSSSSSDDQLLEALARKVVSKVEGLLTAPPISGSTEGTAEITFVASIDLATTLTAIQGELSGQQACLYSLTDSIKSALEERRRQQETLCTP